MKILWLRAEYVLKQHIKRFLSKLHSYRTNKKQLTAEIDSLFTHYQKNMKFVFPSPGSPWGYMFQRPQQLAKHFAKKGNLVFYSVEGNYRFVPDNSVRGLYQISTGLFLHNDFSGGTTLSDRDLIVWCYWANQYSFYKRIFNKAFLIYDWLDDISVHNYSLKEKELHKKLLKQADMVITSSLNLFEEARKYRDDVLLINNACDFEHFSNPKRINWKQLDDLRATSKYLVGYYGAIAQWFDFDLLMYCAKKLPHWNFLIVGEIYSSVSHNVKELKKLSNIVVWDRVGYDKLPYLLSNLDSTIIPFKLNDITHATSPVKLYEYMAGGKPVISTNMHEVAKIKNILIGYTPNDFVKKLLNGISLSKDIKYKARIQGEAKKNSWDKRTETIIMELKKRGLGK